MHPHLPTNTNLLIISPIAGIVLGVILMIVIDRALDRRGHEVLAAIFGIIALLAAPLIGIAIPFLV